MGKWKSEGKVWSYTEIFNWSSFDLVYLLSWWHIFKLLNNTGSFLKRKDWYSFSDLKITYQIIVKKHIVAELKAPQRPLTPYNQFAAFLAGEKLQSWSDREISTEVMQVLRTYRMFHLDMKLLVTSFKLQCLKICINIFSSTNNTN